MATEDFFSAPGRCLPLLTLLGEIPAACQAAQTLDAPNPSRRRETVHCFRRRRDIAVRRWKTSPASLGCNGQQRNLIVICATHDQPSPSTGREHGHSGMRTTSRGIFPHSRTSCPRNDADILRAPLARISHPPSVGQSVKGKHLNGHGAMCPER